MKKEQGQYKPKNQFEALVINQFTNINNHLENVETEIKTINSRIDNVEIEIKEIKHNVNVLKDDVRSIKNTPTMKRELN